MQDSLALTVAAGLAVGIVLLLLFAIFIPVQLDKENQTGAGSIVTTIVTTPTVSEEQAADIVASHLQQNIVGFKDYGIYLTGEGYKHYSEFKARGIRIPLIFTHENGTMLFANSTTLQIFGSCTNTEEQICEFSSNFVAESRGRLVYAFDISIETNNGRCEGPDFFVVDAVSGEIAFSFKDEKPETLPTECIRNEAEGS